MNIPDRWKKLAGNVALAALAAFTGALAVAGVPSKAVVIAAGYAALRAAVGALIIYFQDK